MPRSKPTCDFYMTCNSATATERGVRRNRDAQGEVAVAWVASQLAIDNEQPARKLNVTGLCIRTVGGRDSSDIQTDSLADRDLFRLNRRECPGQCAMANKLNSVCITRTGIIKFQTGRQSRRNRPRLVY